MAVKRVTSLIKKSLIVFNFKSNTQKTTRKIKKIRETILKNKTGHKFWIYLFKLNNPKYMKEQM